MARNIMFSGGIPADGPEGVFALLAETTGDRALSWPDGETNEERRGWIGALNRVVFPAVPCFEPAPEDPERVDGRTASSTRLLTIREGATVDLRGHLPYAHDAIASYEVFSRLKAEGKVPAGTRFQVSVPGAHDVVSITFPNHDEWPAVIAAWQEALQDEFRKILEVIPAEELTVQLDFCTELIHIGGEWAKLMSWVPDLPSDELFELYTSLDYLAPHFAGLPNEVRIGFHVCCGTSPYFPVQPLDTIELPVRLSNAIQASLGGRVDYVHLPAMQDSGEAYFAPLADLTIGDATVYLGLECNDGLEAMTRRIEAARPALADFGVAHYCGYFWNKEIMPDLMATLAAGADVAAA